MFIFKKKKTLKFAYSGTNDLYSRGKYIKRMQFINIDIYSWGLLLINERSSRSVY